MITEFDKFWEATRPNVNKEFCRRIWETAQRRLLDTLHNPPCIPEVGDQIRLHSLCHPQIIGEIRKVTAVHSEELKLYTIETESKRDGETWYSSGILGEVEKVNETPATH